jgi:RNA polymerase sigma factor (sigma-70 family)
MAREQLIKVNLRRVVEICREYEGGGLSLLDLISEGNVGLLKAVDRFKPGTRSDFASHSTRWIRQAIERAVGGGGNMPSARACRVDEC